MILKKLYIGAFGKLKDKEIELKPGLNVIFGENGSGKSTLMQFIKTAFYGFDRKERGASLPWDGAKPNGFVLFESGGRELMTSVKFGKTARGDSFLTTDNLSGDEVSDEPMGRSVFDMSAAAFSKTAFISSGAAIEAKSDDEIAEKLSNLQTSGDESVSFAAAEADIDSAMAKLIAKRGSGGRIQQLEAAIEEIKSELNAAYSNLDGMKNTKNSLKEAYALKDEFEKNIVFLKKSVEAEKFLQLKALKQSIEEIGDVPDMSGAEKAASEIRKLSSEVESLEAAMNGFENETENRIEIPETDFNAASEIYYKSASKNPVFFASAALAVGFAVLGFFNPYFFIGSVLLAALAFFKRPKSKSVSDITEKYGFPDFESFRDGYMEQTAKRQFADKMKAEKAQTEKKLGDAQMRLKIAEDSARERFRTDSSGELEQLFRKSEKAKIEKAAYEKSYSALLKNNDYAALEKLYGNFEPVSDGLFKLERKENELREINEKILRLERQSGAASAAAQPCEIERRKDELTEKLNRLRSDYACLEIVKDTLGEARDIMEGEFGMKLNDAAGEILNKITSGYSSVRMNRNYGVKLMEGAEMHEAKEFSTGLFEQIYLSFRLAMLSLMDCPSPGFLDDSLMTYDDQRAENTLNFLASCERQTILFTCRRRDAELAGAVGANIIEI